MKQVTLTAQQREISNKQGLKTLRKKGSIPAVFYGLEEETTPLSINAKEFEKIMHSMEGSNILLNLDINGNTKTAIIKEIQNDIITDKPLHIDFLAVSLKEKIEVNVPFHITGVAPGVKLSGGVLGHILREVRVRCFPTDIPNFIEVDVSNLQLNDSISVKDLPPIKDVEIVTDPEGIIVNVVSPTILEEAPKPAEGEVVAATPTSAEPRRR